MLLKNRFDWVPAGSPQAAKQRLSYCAVSSVPLSRMSSDAAPTITPNWPDTTCHACPRASQTEKLRLSKGVLVRARRVTAADHGSRREGRGTQGAEGWVWQLLARLGAALPPAVLAAARLSLLAIGRRTRIPIASGESRLSASHRRGRPAGHDSTGGLTALKDRYPRANAARCVFVFCNTKCTIIVFTRRLLTSSFGSRATSSHHRPPFHKISKPLN